MDAAVGLVVEIDGLNALTKRKDDDVDDAPLTLPPQDLVVNDANVAIKNVILTRKMLLLQFLT